MPLPAEFVAEHRPATSSMRWAAPWRWGVFSGAGPSTAAPANIASRHLRFGLAFIANFFVPLNAARQREHHTARRRYFSSLISTVAFALAVLKRLKSVRASFSKLAA